MGHRLEIYLPEQFADTIIDISKSFGIEAKIIGHCEPCQGKKLTISNVNGRFDY